MNMLTNKQRKIGKYIQITLFTAFFIYLAWRNMMLFHIFVSLADIVVAFSITMIAVNTRQFSKNEYLTFLGISTGFIAIFELFYLINESKLSIFVNNTANFSEQFIIIIWYLKSFSLLVSFMFLRKTMHQTKLKVQIIFADYLIVTVLIFLSIFYFENFPKCISDTAPFLPTMFKKISGYLISGVFFGAIVMLIRHKENFHPDVFKYMLISFCSATGSQILSGMSSHPYGSENMNIYMYSCLLELVSTYFLYRAVIKTNLITPYDFLFFELNSANKELNQINYELKINTEALLIVNEKLNNSETRLRAFVDNAADGIIILDNKGIILLFNNSAEKLFGFTSSDIIGQPLSYLILNLHVKHDQFSEFVAQTGEINNTGHEGLGLRNNNSTFPVEFTINDFHDGGEHLYISIIRDITKRKEEERELHLWAKTFETVLSGIVITDTYGIIQSVNQSFILTTGYIASEIVGKNPRILKSGTHNGEFYREMWDHLISDGHWEGEIWNRRKNGEIFPEWLNINVIKDNTGQAIHYIGVFRDITTDMELRQEFILAGKIQKSFLRKDLENDFLRMKTIFCPHQFVSGDFYDYRWDSSKNILHGFLLDVMGHGLSTALQISALWVLFNQTTEKDLSLSERLTWINQTSIQYFSDGSFGAAISFDINFNQQTISFCSAGISEILYINNDTLTIITVPGLFLGINRDEKYEEICIPIKPKDSFFFLTDGLYDELTEKDHQSLNDFSRVMDRLMRIAERKDLADDATALGIYIKE